MIMELIIFESVSGMIQQMKKEKHTEVVNDVAAGLEIAKKKLHSMI